MVQSLPAMHDHGRLLILFLAFLYLQFNIVAFRVFNGYGVAREVNTIIGRQILPEYELVWFGLVPRKLMKYWKTESILFVFSVLFALIFGHLFGRSDVAGAGMMIAYVIALMTLSDVVLWFGAERKRQWYLDRMSLYILLRENHFHPVQLQSRAKEIEEKGIPLF